MAHVIRLQSADGWAYGKDVDRIPLIITARNRCDNRMHRAR